MGVYAPAPPLPLLPHQQQQSGTLSSQQQQQEGPAPGDAWQERAPGGCGMEPQQSDAGGSGDGGGA
eukprot:36294-Chlamydomonas_euryale.AAC.1